MRSRGARMALVALLVVQVAGTKLVLGESLFAMLWRALGFDAKPKLGQVLKGGHSHTLPAMALWMLDAKGSAKPLGSETGLRWPRFERDGKSVWALKNTVLVQVAVSGGEVLARVPLHSSGGPVVADLELLGLDQDKLYAIDALGRAHVISRASGAMESLGVLDGPESNGLRDAARTCKGRRVFAGEREQGPGGPSTDRVRLFEQLGKNKVKPLEFTSRPAIAVEPAHSPDCKQIVFVGAEYW